MDTSTDTTAPPGPPSRERPLVLPGTRTVVVTGPLRQRPLVRPLLWVVRRLPIYKDTRRGRAVARQAKVVGVVTGLVIALLGQSLHTAMLGVLVLIVAPALPMSPMRRVRWTTALERQQRGAEQRVTAPVEVLFDGGRVQVRSDGRIAQTVDAETTDGAALALDGRACLRFGPAGPKALLVVCDGEAPAGVEVGAAIERGAVPPIMLAPAAWARLYGALVAPERRKQRRQELRERRRIDKERRLRPR